MVMDENLTATRAAYTEAGRAHHAACVAFVAARDAEWTPEKAALVAKARAECNRLKREADRLWIALNCAKAGAA
jgi:hypothetical protein